MSTFEQQAAVLANEAIESVSSSVLRTLLYYDLFKYPLTIEEIKLHCSRANCSETSVQDSLDELCKSALVFRYEHLYSLQNNPELFLRRIRGNQAAEEAMKKAERRSKLIGSFPFVRCVCISGSFSKKYFDETTDIDFFIITEPNRLWVCRTFLVLFKKIFLLNDKKYFCVNYFIDSDSLLIPDKNIFTATEVITLLPMYNYALYEKFFHSNHWVKLFFPNSDTREQNGTLPVIKGGLKTAGEKLLRGNLGEWLDRFFFKQTLAHWRKKFNWQPTDEFEVNMRSRRSVSKHHPQGFQFQVLKKYEEKVRSFEQQHQLTLS